MNRQLPPFGREVSRILKNPSELNSFACCHAYRGSVWIATGPGAWDWKYRHPHLLTIVMPDGDNPNSYDWGFLCGHEPPIILPPLANDIDASIELAKAMLRDGCNSVLANSTRFTRKES